MDSKKIQRKRSVVAAALNTSHEYSSISAAIRNIAENLSPPLPDVIARGDTVLLKVNMGCSGVRSPHLRYTSHPAYVEAIIEILQDCGARVMFGDDVSREPRHIPRLWHVTGMTEVATRTGAKLVDFMAAGGREMRGSLLYPRTHFITNLAFEADTIVNAANCRSLSDVVMSGAIKNMFGAVLGRRKRKLHALYPDIRDFSRVLVDIFQLVKPVVSFLDLTSVIEGQGRAPQVQPVGLVIGSSDPVALDTIAAEAIGYDELTLWTSVFGQKVGLGNNDTKNVDVLGIDWRHFPKRRLLHPGAARMGRGNVQDQVTRFLNNTALRLRPVISARTCTGCGDCASRCPAAAITARKNFFEIDLAKCADCGCCTKVCESGAVMPQFVGIGKMIRTVEALIRSDNRPRPADFFE